MAPAKDVIVAVPRWISGVCEQVKGATGLDPVVGGSHAIKLWLQDRMRGEPADLDLFVATPQGDGIDVATRLAERFSEGSFVFNQFHDVGKLYYFGVREAPYVVVKKPVEDRIEATEDFHDSIFAVMTFAAAAEGEKKTQVAILTDVEGRSTTDAFLEISDTKVAVDPATGLVVTPHADLPRTMSYPDEGFCEARKKKYEGFGFRFL